MVISYLTISAPRFTELLKETIQPEKLPKGFCKEQFINDYLEKANSLLGKSIVEREKLVLLITDLIKTDLPPKIFSLEVAATILLHISCFRNLDKQEQEKLITLTYETFAPYLDEMRTNGLFFKTEEIAKLEERLLSEYAGVMLAFCEQQCLHQAKKGYRAVLIENTKMKFFVEVEILSEATDAGNIRCRTINELNSTMKKDEEDDFNVYFNVMDIRKKL